MQPLRELSDLIAEFPGIGPRQARRIVQFLLSAGAPFREKIAKLIVGVAAATTKCSKCFRYDEVSKTGMCSICGDSSRDQETLVVVEKDVDILGVEGSGAYRGNYFVLGALMAMTQRKNATTARAKELIARVGKSGITEVIFALATTPEGDYTARELMKEIGQRFSSIKTTLLGRGLSVGAEIEYADSETLRSALKNRA